MNSFQVMVIGLLVLILGGAGFYFIKADRYGVLAQSISGNRTDVISNRISELSGEYTCSPDNGCQDTINLTLNEDGSFYFTTIYENGAETLAEKGRWFITNRGKNLNLNVTENQNQTYESIKSIIVNSMTVAALTKLVFSKEDYSNMDNPKFWKNQ